MTRGGAGLVDALLADRYRLVERIAVGGMGEVWRAQDVVLDRIVAVKTLRDEYLDNEDFRARFRAEARHAARLTHPGIASVHDFGEAPGEAWLVMELVDGEPLSAVLRREGALSVDRTLDVLAQTAAALHAAHEGGVIHRDVKPGNLLVAPDGVVKVTDFGIAAATGTAPLTETGLVLGTAHYLSPEQASGRSGSPASDVYSLGVVGYECLAGRRPFAGDSAVAIAMGHLHQPVPPLPEAVPPAVRALVLRALAKDPADRFSDALELSGQASRLRAALGAGSRPAAQHDGGLAALAAGAADGPDATREPLASTGVLDLAGLQNPPREEPAAAGGGRRTSRRAVRLVTAALAALVLVLGLGLRSPAGTEPTEPGTVVVPTVAAGTPEAAAVRVLTEAELGVSRRTRASVAVPAGSVIALQPPSGSELPPGADVVMIVSSGPPRVEVTAEQYVGKPVDEVRSALAGRGLVPRLAYDGSGTPVGTVSAVEPVGQLAVGSDVLLHVVPEPPPAPEPAVAPAPDVQPAPEPPADPPAKGRGDPPGNPPGKGKGRGGA
jgi:tRNA A-37 threonylcarbamoyl transferase component Bud32